MVSRAGAYDNAVAESVVDTIKTELVRDRVWQARSQLELAIVEYVGWFNGARLHASLDELTPAQFEALHAPQFKTPTTIKIQTSNQGVGETQPASGAVDN